MKLLTGASSGVISLQDKFIICKTCDCLLDYHLVSDDVPLYMQFGVFKAKGTEIFVP